MKVNKIMSVFIIIVSAIVFLYIKTNWQYWTQNEQEWKMTCTFPETKGHIQTVSDYKFCLAKRLIKPTDADIRKMCYYYSRDEYNIETGNYPTDTDPIENSLYSACLHEQGLPN